MIKNFKWIKNIYKDKFKRYSILILIILGLFLVFRYTQPVQEVSAGDLELHFFFHPNCPHCQEQKPFNEMLMKKYPDVKFIYHDITKADESSLFFEYAKKHNIPRQNLGVPATFFGDKFFIGFESAETTGIEINSALDSYVSGEEISEVQKFEQEKTIALPIIGQINALDYSLPALAVILGLVDGFNPCAMWVLVY